MLPLLSTVPHVADLPTITPLLLLLQSCNFAAVINCSVNMCLPVLLDSPCERVVDPPKGRDAQAEN